MTLRIRLRKQGRTNRSFYRLVLTDICAPRDGKYTETLGWYNPHEAEAEKNASVKLERIQYWLSQGAQLSDKAHALVKRVHPELMREYAEKLVAQKAKKAAKKRARRRAKKAALAA